LNLESEFCSASVLFPLFREEQPWLINFYYSGLILRHIHGVLKTHFFLSFSHIYTSNLIKGLFSSVYGRFLIIPHSTSGFLLAFLRGKWSELSLIMIFNLKFFNQSIISFIILILFDFCASDLPVSRWAAALVPLMVHTEEVAVDDLFMSGKCSKMNLSSIFFLYYYFGIWNFKQRNCFTNSIIIIVKK
jgi:hypothetical protein